MERQPSLPADDSAQVDSWNHPLWILVFLVLIAGQGWMTLSLFGPKHPWARLFNDEPIVSGSHPLHLYFGYLGAQTLYERGSLCTYDPAFQAGYPKTPVFDSGSRPAELFLAVAGNGYRPAAYKVGIAICCCLAPLLFMIAARGLGLNRAASCLAVALGLVVWWGNPCRDALQAGDLDLLLAGLATLAMVGLLIRFDRTPDGRGWVGLVLLGGLGWFTQPFIIILILPLFLVYYLTIGARHKLNWHLALLGSLAGALAGNSFWITDWVKSWWIRTPLQAEGEELMHRTFHTIWNASLWGDAADRALAVFLVVLAGVGVLLLNQRRERAAARLLGMGVAGFLILAVWGIANKSLGRLGTSQLFVLALWFAIPPAVYALVQGCRLAVQLMGNSSRGAALVAGVLLVPGVIGHEFVLRHLSRWRGTTPLEIGLGPDRLALVKTIQEKTQEEARILIEDRPDRREAPRWTALLPILTNRAYYLGGLDPDGWIEHSFPRLADQTLAGRSIAKCTDAELEDYCRHYNVGWAVCWSPAAVARFRAWQGTQSEVPIVDEGPGSLFTFRPRSFILKGKAQVLCIDRRRIALANVIPEDGRVVVSLHYQSGMQASPGRVQVERDPDPYDPIPFIRLRVPGPAALITLTWDDE